MNKNEALLGWNYFNAPPLHHISEMKDIIMNLIIGSYLYCILTVCLKLEKAVLLWARFINSLHQSKPSFGLKNLLLGFTKNVQ